MVSDKDKRRSSSSSNRKSKSDEPPSHPRICSIVRGPAGYGFNLHGEKGQHGQYIRAVDQDSPAERSGLRTGDRVIEVNNINIERETHSQVVARIREGGNSTVLLVLDKELDTWYKKRGVTVKRDMIPGYKEPETIQQNGKEESPEVNGVSQSSEEIEVPVAAAAAIAITEDNVNNKEEVEETPAPVEEAEPEVTPEPTSPEEEEPSRESSEVEYSPPTPPQEPEPVHDEPEPVMEAVAPAQEEEPVHEEEDVPSFVAPAEPAKPKDTSGLDLSDMSKARSLAMGQSKKKNAQANDWKSKYQAFNQL
ncbi:Na(+)/H(+) exchange regulatory cofactor NHE-RF1-like [Anneissia japonica]|uniref:Na(+)/H(+) exchange regulatory cofactor NHE-RF1-like n=1 Tax=Anneissia japonica TaxID=1529436 RepID=UPI00142595B7|nr:Na(+)/H(+) exchange regulatory cofactor NHE-RF1-like [Anneissia japonica]